MRSVYSMPFTQVHGSQKHMWRTLIGATFQVDRPLLQRCGACHAACIVQAGAAEMQRMQFDITSGLNRLCRRDVAHAILACMDSASR